MRTVSFGHAFERWYRLVLAERTRLDDEKKRGAALVSLEALDHMCGLAVESGLKALMIKAKLVSPEPNGDFPRDRSTGHRQHIDRLWDAFAAKANNRTTSAWLSRLGGGAKGTPPNVFRGWRAEHRYASDGTVDETAAAPRIAVARRLNEIAQEEGL